MRSTRRCLTATGVAIAACAGMAAASMGDGAPALPRPPQLLSQTGLYAQPGASRIDPRNLHYSPQYPLWSDGAEKWRWVFIPAGMKIDARATDAWDFPVGTKFWKEFAFAGRKAETRLLWKVSDRDWVFATYVWSPDQRDAALAPEEGIPGLVEIAKGKRHSIPSVLDCKLCHDSRRTEILGFTALQLSTDRDPNAPHAEPLVPGMVTLQTLADRQLLEPARPDLLRHPPRIPGDSPRTRSALGYMTTNCASCHNPEHPIASLGLMLQHASDAAAITAEPALQTALGEPSRWPIPGTKNGETVRLAPGGPARSAVLHRMRSRSPVSQMPPVGSVLVDEEAVQLFSEWITEDLPALARGSASGGGGGSSQ